MNLEQIKIDKVKEAEELFLKLGINYNQEQIAPTYFGKFLTDPLVVRKEEDKKDKLIWTRLSINSDIGCIVE